MIEKTIEELQYFKTIRDESWTRDVGVPKLSNRKPVIHSRKDLKNKGSKNLSQIKPVTPRHH